MLGTQPDRVGDIEWLQRHDAEAEARYASVEATGCVRSYKCAVQRSTFGSINVSMHTSPAMEETVEAREVGRIGGYQCQRLW